jgi:hypothetical protein
MTSTFGSESRQLFQLPAAVPAGGQWARWRACASTPPTGAGMHAHNVLRTRVLMPQTLARSAAWVGGGLGLTFHHDF